MVSSCKQISPAGWADFRKITMRGLIEIAGSLPPSLRNKFCVLQYREDASLTVTSGRSPVPILYKLGIGGLQQG